MMTSKYKIIQGRGEKKNPEHSKTFIDPAPKVVPKQGSNKVGLTIPQIRQYPAAKAI